jgi:hypothetical protein
MAPLLSFLPAGIPENNQSIISRPSLVPRLVDLKLWYQIVFRSATVKTAE